MRIEVRDSLGDVSCTDWNALNASGNPFLRYEFFAALENNDCLGENHGWFPRYFLQYTDKDRLIAAVPAFIKTNSYGEFVFDWSWAEAYHKNGQPYYPKMVVAAPYTPVSGNRLLVAPDVDYLEIARPLHQAVRSFCKEHNLTGLHWLFTTEDEVDLLESDGLMRRVGCQYHWSNNGYRDFDDFLSQLRSSRRKKIKRERRRAVEHGIELVTKHGHELNDDEVARIHHYYVSTFDKKWGEASLTLGFFADVAKSMGESLVVVFARQQQNIVACSVMFRDDHSLYGRYWGCDEDYNSLHFETCFYRGIDYCIANKLQRFEPGAQGEHKIWRGFLPTKTWSAHWIADPRFSDAIRRYLIQESELMDAQCKHLMQLSPFHREHID